MNEAEFAATYDELKARVADLMRELDEWREAAGVEAAVRRGFSQRVDAAEARLAGLEGQLQVAHRNALERAAQVAESKYADPRWHHYKTQAGQIIAGEIRALAPETEAPSFDDRLDAACRAFWAPWLDQGGQVDEEDRAHMARALAAADAAVGRKKETER